MCGPSSKSVELRALPTLQPPVVGAPAPARERIRRQDRFAPLHNVAVWTGDAGSVIELMRISGPHEGFVDAPPHLLKGGPSCRINLAAPGVKIRLYTACLLRGSPFDVYRLVNLRDLAALLTRLPLPAPITDTWRAALCRVGLMSPLLELPTSDVRRPTG